MIYQGKEMTLEQFAKDFMIDAIESAQEDMNVILDASGEEELSDEDYTTVYAHIDRLTPDIEKLLNKPTTRRG